MAQNRTFFDTKLNELEDKVVRLANLTMRQTATAIEVLEKHDLELAQTVIDNDNELDDLELEINDEAILLIAKQQPVATDLRRLIVTMKSATDLERIADYATNIAKAVTRIEHVPYVLDIKPLKQMAEQLIDMLELATRAYRKGEVSRVRDLNEMDKVIDDLNLQTIKQYMGSVPTMAVGTNDVYEFSNIARYLERMGDHVTNFGEHLIFLEKGKHYDLNQ
ncbi:phosphate signaling complex protein PhoU [Exiguobacterium sp. s56]|uniref:phosphate signaling complex protein PhoU n=1 Tax=Exiguobacterium sp. s56 TaxID=2751232 RepID=UPI001BE9F0FB|nr:phosphate signaling complex protein PhoU [Exiguobacterium sp. s56]